MKIILLQHLSGAKTLAPKDEMEVSDAEAMRFIGKGIAKAKNAKAYKDLVTRLEKHNATESEKQTKIIAIQKEEELTLEANLLLAELLAIVSTIESVNPKYRDTFLEKFHKAFVSNDTNDENKTAKDEQNNEGDLVDNSGEGN